MYFIKKLDVMHMDAMKQQLVTVSIVRNIHVRTMAVTIIKRHGVLYAIHVMK